MRHILFILFAVIINCVPARSVRADIIYTFTTVSPAPLAAPVSGTFLVSDSAILDNFIFATEIKSYDFRLLSATIPFSPATFAPPDPLMIASPFGGGILVDPVTGAFLADSNITIIDGTTLQRLGLTTFPGTVPPLVPQYQVIIGTAPFEQLTQGSGAWNVQRVPEPPPILLVGVAGLSLALAHYRHRQLSLRERGRRRYTQSPPSVT